MFKDTNIMKKGITKSGVVIKDQCISAGHHKHFQKIRSIVWLDLNCLSHLEIDDIDDTKW